MDLMWLTLQHLFTPHVTNNHRPRILHPAGLAVVMGVFLLLNSWVRLLSAATLPRGVVLGYASNITTTQVIDLTNAERAKAGLPSLAHNSLLSQAATAKAADMFKNDYWAHIAPDGTTPWVFIKGAGYQYQVAGENLARDFGDTPSMITAWMNSPTHRENILNAKFAEIGVAVVNGKLGGVETTLVVQMYGKPTKALAQTGLMGISTLEPTQMPTPSLAPAVLAQAEPETYVSPARVMISPMQLTKAIALSVVLMLVGVLFYDEILMHFHKIPRRVGKNWAHLTLLGIVIMMIVALTEGKIL